MNKAKKAIIGSSVALLGAGYLIGRKQQEHNKPTYQKFLDRLEKALD